VPATGDDADDDVARAHDEHSGHDADDHIDRLTDDQRRWLGQQVQDDDDAVVDDPDDHRSQAELPWQEPASVQPPRARGHRRGKRLG
jgi:hypothetical protein